MLVCVFQSVLIFHSLSMFSTVCPHFPLYFCRGFHICLLSTSSLRVPQNICPVVPFSTVRRSKFFTLCLSIFSTVCLSMLFTVCPRCSRYVCPVFRSVLVLYSTPVPFSTACTLSTVRLSRVPVCPRSTQLSTACTFSTVRLGGRTMWSLPPSQTGRDQEKSALGKEK